MRKHLHFLSDISTKLEDLKIWKFSYNNSISFLSNSKTNPCRFKQQNTFSIYGVELVISISLYLKASLFKQEKKIICRFQQWKLNLNPIRTCSYHFTATCLINLNSSYRVKTCSKFLISSLCQCLTSLNTYQMSLSKTILFKAQLRENNNLIDTIYCLIEKELIESSDNESQNKCKIFQFLILVRWEIYFQEKCRNS